MGRGEADAHICFQRFCIPFLCGQIQIRIDRLPPFVDQHPPVGSDNTDVKDIAAAVQDRFKLSQDPFSGRARIPASEQVLLHVFAAGYDIGDILHIVDIGINILIHLPDNRPRIQR